MGSALRGVVILIVVLSVATLIVTAQGIGETRIRFQSPDGGFTSAFEVKLAFHKADRARGLKYVKRLDADKGMLFIFPKEKVQSFWMKDTYVALDMIFVDSAKKIVGVIHSVPPFTTEHQVVQAKSTYVVELVAGTAKRLGLKIGDTLIVEQPIPNPSEVDLN